VRRWASIADESCCDPRLRLTSPRLRSGRSRVLRILVFGPSRPSVGSARKERGLEPRAVNQIGTRPPGRWGNARRSAAPAPQSKPVTPASRLVAQVAPSVASGLGLSVPAAGPARQPQYSCCGRMCEQTSKPARDSSWQKGRPASRRPSSPTGRCSPPARTSPALPRSSGWRWSRAGVHDRDAPRRTALRATTDNDTTAAVTAQPPLTRDRAPSRIAGDQTTPSSRSAEQFARFDPPDQPGHFPPASINGWHTRGRCSRRATRRAGRAQLRNSYAVRMRPLISPN
jgi:hypothetical protein